MVAGALFAAAGAATAWAPGLAEKTAEWTRGLPAPAETLHSAPPEWRAAAALLAGIGAAWVGGRVRPAWRAWGLTLAAAALTAAQCLVFKLHGVAWEPLSLLAALGAGFSASLLFTPKTAPDEEIAAATPAGAEAARLFRGRVSKALLRRLTEVTDTAFLQPAQREAAVVTCRLLNEHALRENLPARDFLKLSEAFRARAAEVLMEHGGCLDPAESAGVRAFFGLPLPSPAGAEDEAAAAALALDEALRRFAVDHMSPDAEPPSFGIGIASGTLTAGLTDEHYSALGDAVELSRWLAGENTNYHSRILMDERTRARAVNTEDRPLEVCNPPEGAAVEIFQLLSPRGGLSFEAVKRRDAFRDAIMLLRAGHAEDAIQRFNEARRGLLSPDPVLEHFLSQAEDQLRRDQSSPALARKKSRPFRKPHRHP